jgi:hypothetical protein
LSRLPGTVINPPLLLFASLLARSAGGLVAASTCCDVGNLFVLYRPALEIRLPNAIDKHGYWKFSFFNCDIMNFNFSNILFYKIFEF